jgi:PAS domain S-box-containing protein
MSAAPGSDELLRLVLASATDYAIFSIDPHGVVTSWNTGAENLLGYSEAEIIGLSADIIFTAEDNATGVPESERTQALIRGRAEDERWQVRKSGEQFFASGLLMPLADKNSGFVKILRDRTQLHQAESRLRENEEHFRLLATNIPQLVFRSKFDGNRTWGSPQWIAFTGLSLADSVGFGWLDAVHPDDRAETVGNWQSAREAGEYYIEHRIRRAVDSTYRWHQTRARPIEGADIVSDWVGTMTDVHDLRGLQDRQKVLMAELQHRTRNLLTVTQSIARQTLRTSRSLEEFKGQFESRLHALSRVQALLARADEEDIDLRKLVIAEVSAHHDPEKDRDRLQINGPAVHLPAMSAQALGLALHELATNAVKYGALSRSDGKLHISWTVERSSPNGLVKFQWVETGVKLGSHKPERKGYGSELIEKALPYQLSAETKLEFASDGVRCAITVPLRANSTGG